MTKKLQQLIDRIPWGVYALLAGYFFVRIVMNASSSINVIINTIGCACMTYLVFYRLEKGNHQKK